MGNPKEPQTGLVRPQDFSPETLISKAIDQNLPVETMEKLLAMRRELKTEWSKEHFDGAMAKFQGECPVVKKEKKVNNSAAKGGGFRYAYAPLDEIVRQVGPTIAKNGFSYTINSSLEGNMVKATVRVTHKDGHSQESSFVVPTGSDAFMTLAQTYGAAMTFAKRYAFTNAFGILTGDVDTDANASGNGADERTYNAALKMIGNARTLGELTEFKLSISSGRGKKIYSEEQRGQLIRMIDAKAEGIANGA